MPQAGAGLGHSSIANQPDVRFSGVSSSNSGGHGSYYSNTNNSVLIASHETNVWAATPAAGISDSPALSAGYSPRPHSYLPQGSHASMQMQTTPILPQHTPRVQHLQTFTSQPGGAPPHMLNNSVTFSTPSQSPYIGMAGQQPPPHAVFAKTPYPAMAANPHGQVAYVDPPQPAFTADYFNDNNSDSLSRDVQAAVEQPTVEPQPAELQPSHIQEAAAASPPDQPAQQQQSGANV
ncbi:hypothetical protein GGF44_004891 [Coemansia sp. RSA 1694]|nr:hypothetical protein GGF44_004891 [Coemansia sp. RSA 1694]